MCEFFKKGFFLSLKSFNNIHHIDYKDILALFNLNESSEHRKVLSFQIYSMLNQSGSLSCTLQAGIPVWIK